MFDWEREYQNKRKWLTWIPVVEIVLYVAGYVVSFSVVDPVWICFDIISNEDPEQDDHGHLPHCANRRQTDANIGIFWTVTQLSEALNTAHLYWPDFFFQLFLFLQKVINRQRAQSVKQMVV